MGYEYILSLYVLAVNIRISEQGAVRRGRRFASCPSIYSGGINMYRKVLIIVLVLVFLISSVAFAQPAWKQAGELPPGLQNKGGPPGQLRIAQVAQPATLEVLFDDGSVIIVDGVARGQTVQFAVTYQGIVVSATALQNSRISYWEGQGLEWADMSAYDEATWYWVWTSGGAKGRGRQVLTIGYAEGILYEPEPPIDEEPPIDDPEPDPEEPEKPELPGEPEEPVEPIVEE
jgi:hypothetical protein